MPGEVALGMGASRSGRGSRLVGDPAAMSVDRASERNMTQGQRGEDKVRQATVANGVLECWLNQVRAVTGNLVRRPGPGGTETAIDLALEGFAGCGDFELGFVRTCCRNCGDELRVPFSCKSRGCCPSCMGRRMAEGAALLVDHVLPAVGYRQWVLSFPGPLAVRL